jgi:hypothetical protein
MYRLKLLMTVAVSLLFLHTALPAFAADESLGDYSSKTATTAIPIDPSASPVSELCPPTFSLDAADTFYICPGRTIFDTIIVKSEMTTAIITLTKESGQGNFTSTPSISPVVGFFDFTPDTSGSYVVTFKAIDNAGRTATATITYVVFINGAPVITTGDTAFYDCFPIYDYSYKVSAHDPDNDPLVFSLLNGEGAIDPVTGVITYRAIESGKYCFTVEVSDSCASDTADICITANLNNLPEISGFRKKIELCLIDSVCFDINASDPDEGDSLEIIQIEGPGSFIMTDPYTGRTCFFPENVDSADYIFIYGATDKCLRGEGTIAQSTPPLPFDTVIITVIIKPAAQITCPDDTVLFICQPDTICIPIGEIPSRAEVSVIPPSAWYDSENQSICFYTNCSVKKDIKFTVTTECGTDSCQFSANVTMNAAPLVALGPDTSVFLCANNEVCIDAGISDVNDNISDIIVSNDGRYDPITNEICFRPSNSGTYYLTLKAIDECGAFDIDTVVVTVNINKPPVTKSADNFVVSQCALSPICFPVSISDPDNNIANIVVYPFGAYNKESKSVCFTPKAPGNYRIIITAVDSCGAFSSDTTIAIVLLNSAPVVKANDSTVFLCKPERVCFPVTVTDINNNVEYITTGGANYLDGYVCFTPTVGGNYRFIVAAMDSCGAWGADTAIINVVINNPPHVISAEDFTVLRCDMEPICFDVNASDPEGNLAGIGSTLGQYNSETHQICFTPEKAGQYTIVVMAADSCYAIGADTTVVTVNFGKTASIECPEGPINMASCGATTFCYSLAIAPSDAWVQTSFGYYREGELCFNADTSGIYNIMVVADSDCGSDTCNLVFNITISEPVVLQCPLDTTMRICDPITICRPVGILPPEAEIMISPIGTYENGNVCFTADTAGIYEIAVRAETGCGADSCHFVVTVLADNPPRIEKEDSTIFVCQPGEQISTDIWAFDADGDKLSFRLLSSFGAIDPETNLLSFVIDTAGHYCFKVEASDNCLADTAEFCYEININSSPTVSSADDFSINLCQTQEICFDMTISDKDNNITSINTNMGKYSDGRICFTPSESGRYEIITTVADECGATKSDTTVITVNIASPVTIECPVSKTITLCGPESICLPLKVSQPDANIAVWPIGSLEEGGICFTPDTAGLYQFLVTASTECYTDSCTFSVEIVYNMAPELVVKDTTLFLCEPGSEVNYLITAGDYERDSIQYSLISGFGQIDGETGLLTLYPDTAGIYCYKVVASDRCGADTAEFCLTVTFNTPPTITTGPDTTISACTIREICIDVNSYDKDDNIVSVSTNYGKLIDGRACFVPPSEPGTYYFIATAIDVCNAMSVDTTIITIEPAIPVELVCPNDTSLVICEPDTICIPLEGVPEGAMVAVSPPSVWYSTQKQSLCFYTNCTVEKNIKIKVGNACGEDSCVVKVNVTMNTRPLAFLPPDSTIAVCDLSAICLPAAVSDDNDNIVSVETSTNASYSPITGRICFTPDHYGINTIYIKAIDACGAYSADSMNVNIVANRPPVVNAESSINKLLCTLSEICFPVNISDPDNGIAAVTVAPYGRYNAMSGSVCFLPGTAGNYKIIITAFDKCGALAADTVNIHVTLNTKPTISVVPDTSVLLCQLEEVCIPAIISDPDGNLAGVKVNNGGTYKDGMICFTPGAIGIYNLIITAVDSCGRATFDTTTVHISLNKPPIVIAPEDFEITRCDLSPICFGLYVNDTDKNIVNINSNYGEYDSKTGELCFNPELPGTYTIVITATDICGLSDADTIVVTTIKGDTAQISCPLEPIGVALCHAGSVCRQLSITPSDAFVSTSYGTFKDGQLCFQADTTGHYIIKVIADAECGADTCFVEFDVNIAPPVQLTCPGDTSMFLCEPGPISRPIGVIPSTADVTVRPLGTYLDGHVNFTADTSGVYNITVIAESECGSDTCDFAVNIKINSAPIVNAGLDTSYFQCNFTQICRPVDISDKDNNLSSVTVSPSGTYNQETHSICFTPSGVGTYCLVVKATDICGKSASDTVCITITTGAVADITCPSSPYERHLCSSGQVCVPLVATPSTAQITVSYGVYTNGQICFAADTAGTYSIRAIATAPCGADTCIIKVNVIFDPIAEITCPSLPTSVSLCRADSVRILVPITPSTATVTVTPRGRYNSTTHNISFYADTAGTYRMTVIATAPCGADTCIVTAVVTIDPIPQITCPGTIDTTICVGKTTEICFPVTIIGSTTSIKVLPSGNYSGGMVCVPVTTAGTYTVSTIAANLCGADTCITTIKVKKNEIPTLTVPADTIVAGCDDELSEICIDGIFAVDPEGKTLTITQTCGPGTYTAVRSDSGKICFTPASADMTYTFCVTATDGCQTVEKSFTYTIYPSPTCNVCLDLAIKTDSCVVVGSNVPVYLTINTNDEIGGFDLLISYDASVLTFYNASKGSAISGWEYFTYRLGDDGACGGCPSGIVRLVGIADMNNGPYHPPTEQLLPQGTLAVLVMHVDNDQNLGGMFLPISFYWVDCGDNAFSDPTGNITYTDLRIYNSSDEIIWDEDDNINYPESERYSGMGAPDSCISGDKTAPLRCIYFHNGGICVKHPDSIDARGDINLNNIPYEIGDAVVFTNFFLYGLTAFTISVDGQTAASDVNADGRVLTVADLVYLTRVIVGDASPITKLSPYSANVDVSTKIAEGLISVAADNAYPIGGALLVFKYEGARPQVPELAGSCLDMDMKYVITDSEIRILIMSYKSGQQIEIGHNEILNIKNNDNCNITLSEAYFGGCHGEMMTARLKNGLIPDKYEVSQNYPNPFNPITAIDLSLPASSQWQLTVFNINGQIVRKFNGESEAGIIKVIWDGRNGDDQPVTSGVYFYKFEAGKYSATKKMILLK